MRQKERADQAGFPYNDKNNESVYINLKTILAKQAAITILKHEHENSATTRRHKTHNTISTFMNHEHRDPVLLLHQAF